MKTKFEMALRSFVLVLATTSCTTWYSVQKDHLPLIAEAFETKKPARVNTTDGDVVEVDPNRGFQFETAADGRLFEGELEALEIRQSDGQAIVYLEPRTDVKTPGWSFPASEVTSVETEALSLGRTAGAVVLAVVGAVAIGCGLWAAVTWNDWGW
jgi:hypothetical protein